MDLRERYIRQQRQRLAPYATGEWDAGGRRFPEDEHPYRTAFQRDRDRVIHCSAFRRLDYKTQVFVPHEQDHFRTRLTHTIEVAQIARTLARALGANEDLAEAVALAHDLGHPPFGHAGEEALAERMAEHGHFEHNRQSLRIVDYLEHPYPPFRGLNLTRAVREGLAKHTTRYDAPICEDFDPSEQPSIEGQLVDACDEIAYTSADLDDALTAGWITLEQLDALGLWRRAWAHVERQYPDARPIHKQIRAAKAVLSLLADDLLATTAATLEALRIDSPDAVRRAGRKVVGLAPALAEELERTQALLMREVYASPANLVQRDDGQRMIRELFDAFVARPERLPERYRRRIDADGLHRVACDYVAGMTDRFCREEHARLISGGPA